MKNKTNIKAVIFDLDGTLVDSEPNYYEADKCVLAKYGIDLTMDMKQKYIGIGSWQMMEDIKEQYNLSESVEKLVEIKNACYENIAREKSRSFPEMVRFVKILADNKYPMAIASGSSLNIIDLVVTVTDLKKYFSIHISSEQVKNGKPAPDVFLLAARQLGVEPEHCLVIEDSQYGVEAATSAGMYCFAVPEYLTEEMIASFNKADLLFAKGMAEFTALKAWSWLGN